MALRSEIVVARAASRRGWRLRTSAGPAASAPVAAVSVFGTLVVSIALAALTGFTAFTAASSARADEVVSIVDDWGRDLRFQRMPRRIVSLAPHATELLFSAGAGPRVVGVDVHSDRPEAARGLPRVSSYPTPDREALLALRPDLVVLWGAAADRELIFRLEALGLVVFVSEPTTLEAIASSLERFGRLGGDEARGAQAAQRLRARIASLRSRYGRSAPVPVFVQAWAKPLLTLSDRDTIGDALTICGARNVFGDMPMAAPQVGVEAVLAASPRLIVAIDEKADRSQWDALRVLAPQGKIEFAAVDASIQRPTDAIADAIGQLCVAVDRARRR
jgi:iron complex transport system substrate-binding protein